MRRLRSVFAVCKISFAVRSKEWTSTLSRGGLQKKKYKGKKFLHILEVYLVYLFRENLIRCNRSVGLNVSKHFPKYSKTIPKTAEDLRQRSEMFIFFFLIFGFSFFIFCRPPSFIRRSHPRLTESRRKAASKNNPKLSRKTGAQTNKSCLTRFFTL